MMYVFKEFIRIFLMKKKFKNGAYLFVAFGRYNPIPSSFMY